MKYLSSVALFLGLTAAQSCVTKPPAGMSPEPCKAAADCNYCYLTMNDLKTGPCKAVTWIFARASTELGNMGASVGTLIGMQLNQTYGHQNVAIQGVDYEAGIMGNIGGVGCSNKGVTNSGAMITLAHTKCPKTVILVGAYSQGTACMHAAIPKLPQEVRNQIAAAVMFGDTKNAQEKGKIRGLSDDKFRIYCNKDDGVCGGSLLVNNGHFAYAPKVSEVVTYLKAAVAKAGGVSAAGKSKRMERAAEIAYERLAAR